jgi:hypothetical protein
MPLQFPAAKNLFRTSIGIFLFVKNWERSGFFAHTSRGSGFWFLDSGFWFLIFLVKLVRIHPV